jgi:protein-S-isoprenylcysteine O-methyltransferase Ste14
MNTAYRILAALWLVAIVYWVVSAVGVKRGARRGRFGLGLRVLFVLVLYALLRWVPAVRQLVSVHATDPVLIGVGLAMCALGLGWAIWARAHLGQNWGMPMSLKQEPELVMTGPYRSIRHPIYSGILLALLGSAIVGGMIWLVVFLFAGAYFGWSARVEDGLMAEEFPTVYPEYKKRTKALIPFIY